MSHRALFEKFTFRNAKGKTLLGFNATGSNPQDICVSTTRRELWGCLMREVVRRGGEGDLKNAEDHSVTWDRRKKKAILMGTSWQDEMVWIASIAIGAKWQ